MIVPTGITKLFQLFSDLTCKDRIFGAVANVEISFFAIGDLGKLAEENFFLIAAQRLGELLAACKTIVRIFRQSLLERNVYVARDILNQIGQLWRCVSLMLVQQFLVCFAVEQGLARNQLVEHCRQCVLVSAAINGQSARLFRS